MVLKSCDNAPETNKIRINNILNEKNISFKRIDLSTAPRGGFEPPKTDPKSVGLSVSLTGRQISLKLKVESLKEKSQNRRDESPKFIV